MNIVFVPKKLHLLVSFKSTVLTFEVLSGPVDRVNVPLHVVDIVAFVVAHLTHIQPLLTVGVAVVLLQVVLVCAFEAAISTSMRVTISLVKSVVMFRIIIHTLTYKHTLFARIVFLPFVMDFNMLFHHTVLVTLKDTPGADTLEVCLSQTSWQTVQGLHTVLLVTIPSAFVLILLMLFETYLIICFIVTVFTLPEFFFMMHSFYVSYKVILPGYFYTALCAVVLLYLLVNLFNMSLQSVCTLVSDESAIVTFKYFHLFRFSFS